ncbi:3-oxoadipate enol-lactonase [Frankia sp. EI5c]|uniref:alpha/beta fold hydrolase n=1 Tax=Frankia sp. EI5c TaxID=683316 RepID=UPI0007C22E68|nr:alpha/beta hydrolase [Frankia sp. EI5c]OAA19787.1 3-oxoadipate enol-lactonase [Frankia sp. EI5c]
MIEPTVEPVGGPAVEPVIGPMIGPAVEPVVEPVVRRIGVASGLELHVEDLRPVAASAAGPPLVLVHGIAGTTADWARVAPELAASRRVIAYDQRGHGASDRAGGRASYTFDLLLADLATLLDALALPQVDLVGHSMGGVVALRYVLEHPERVRSLLLVDTAAAPAAATGVAARLLVSAVLEGAAAIATAVRHAHEPAPAPAVAGSHGGDRVDDTVGAVESGGSVADRQVDGLGRLDPEALVAFGRELGEYPSMVDRLGEISCPVTVIVGERDSTLRAPARVLADGIPGAHLAVIAGADHSPHASRPLAWLTAVDSHFGRLTQF